MDLINRCICFVSDDVLMAVKVVKWKVIFYATEDSARKKENHTHDPKDDYLNCQFFVERVIKGWAVFNRNMSEIWQC